MSQTQKVFSESGVWFTNTGLFPCIDWVSGCRFEPGVRTQAPETAFTKAMGALLAPETPKPEKKLPTKS